MLQMQITCLVKHIIAMNAMDNNECSNDLLDSFTYWVTYSDNQKSQRVRMMYIFMSKGQSFHAEFIFYELPLSFHVAYARKFVLAFVFAIAIIRMSLFNASAHIIRDHFYCITLNCFGFMFEAYKSFGKTTLICQSWKEPSSSAVNENWDPKVICCYYVVPIPNSIQFKVYLITMMMNLMSILFFRWPKLCVANKIVRIASNNLLGT